MTATGNNYAEALFMLAREENSIDEFYESLKTVRLTLEENGEYLQFLSTPSIPKDERTAALEGAFGGRINKNVLSFLQLLCVHGKAETFFECVAEYERLREWASESVVATVETAVELSDSQKQALIKALEKRTGKSVTLNCIKNSSLLGGVRVEIDGEILDGSIKNNLKRAREVIGK